MRARATEAALHFVCDAEAAVLPEVNGYRVARVLGLIKRPVTDWQTATELTASLRLLDPNDPVKYDFSLFGLGAFEGFR